MNDTDRIELEAAGSEIRQFPRGKDETDFELVLNHVVSAGYSEILVVAALGNRLDQTLGNLALLAAPTLAGLDIRVDDGEEQARFVRTEARVDGQTGDVVSLVPWGRTGYRHYHHRAEVVAQG